MFWAKWKLEKNVDRYVYTNGELQLGADGVLKLYSLTNPTQYNDSGREFDENGTSSYQPSPHVNT
jgi:hypothetical protein